MNNNKILCQRCECEIEQNDVVFELLGKNYCSAKCQDEDFKNRCEFCGEYYDDNNYVELQQLNFCCESCLEGYLYKNPHMMPISKEDSATYYGNVPWNRE